MLKRTVMLLVAATLAGGLFATDAQARGGGHGGHMGGGFHGFGHVAGGHFHATHVHGLEHGMYGRGYGYDDWGYDCAPYYWPYSSQWPNVCF
jgi:hypothetical protein